MQLARGVNQGYISHYIYRYGNKAEKRGIQCIGCAYVPIFQMRTLRECTEQVKIYNYILRKKTFIQFLQKDGEFDSELTPLQHMQPESFRSPLHHFSRSE